MKRKFIVIGVIFIISTFILFSGCTMLDRILGLGGDTYNTDNNTSGTVNIYGSISVNPQETNKNGKIWILALDHIPGQNEQIYTYDYQNYDAGYYDGYNNFYQNFDFYMPTGDYFLIAFIDNDGDNYLTIGNSLPTEPYGVYNGWQQQYFSNDTNTGSINIGPESDAYEFNNKLSEAPFIDLSASGTLDLTLDRQNGDEIEEDWFMFSAESGYICHFTIDPTVFSNEYLDIIVEIYDWNGDFVNTYDLNGANYPEYVDFDPDADGNGQGYYYLKVYGLDYVTPFGPYTIDYGRSPIQ